MPEPSPATDLLPNPHPGEILAEDFLKPMGLSRSALARAVDVPSHQITDILRGKRAVTAAIDLRLARYFGMSEEFFLGLQADHDLMKERRSGTSLQRNHLKSNTTGIQKNSCIKIAE